MSRYIKTYSKGGGTICSKHDRISQLEEELREKDKEIENLQEELDKANCKI